VQGKLRTGRHDRPRQTAPFSRTHPTEALSLALSRGVAELHATLGRLDITLPERRRAAIAAIKWINQPPTPSDVNITIPVAPTTLKQIEEMCPRVAQHATAFSLTESVTADTTTHLAFFRGIEELIAHQEKHSEGWRRRRARLARQGGITPTRELAVTVDMARAMESLDPTEEATAESTLIDDIVPRGFDELWAMLDRFDHGLPERRRSARMARSWLRSDTVQTLVPIPIMARFEQQLVLLLPRVSTHSAAFGLSGRLDDDLICQLVCYRGLAAMTVDIEQAHARAIFESWSIARGDPAPRPPMQDNRRIQYRIPIRLPVEIEVGGEICVENTANLSAGGMYIETRRPRPTGTQLSVRFRLPGQAAPIDTPAEVRWVLNAENAGPLPVGMGINFAELPPGARRRVRAFLEKWPGR